MELIRVWDNDEDGNPGERYVTDDYQKASSCRRIVGSRMPKLYGSWSNDVHVGNFQIPRNMKDTFGFALGADWNILPNELTVRAGFLYESGAGRPWREIADNYRALLA